MKLSGFVRSALKPGDLRLFVVLVLILGTLWVSVLWINRQAEQQGLEEMRRETTALALLFATHTDTTFRTVDLALKELREAADLPPDDIAQVIEPHQRLLGKAIVQTGLIDAKGMVTYSTPIPASQPTYAGDREFFTVHQTNKTDTLFVGRPAKGRVSGKWSIHLSRPIFKEGQFAGVALVAVDPDYFVAFYQSAGLGAGGAARMIRDTGEVMARSSEQDKYVGKLIKPSPYADPGAPLQGSFRRKAQVDGVDRLSSYYRLADYGVSVVIGPSVDERLAPVRAHQQQLLAAASLITVLVLLLSWLMRRSTLRNEAAQQAIERSQNKFRWLFESMTEGVALHRLLYNEQGRAVNYQIVAVNAAFEMKNGLAAQAVTGQTATQVYGVTEPPLLDVYAQVVATGQPVTFPHHVERMQRDFEIHVFCYEPDHFATVFLDVTEQKQLQAQRDADHRTLKKQYGEITSLQEQLQEQVLHDPLTQLHNRRFLDESWPREFARAVRDHQPLALVMLDIDHFKRVNDTHGHAVGDLVLLAISRLLRSNARASDILCRFGGEEFLLVMPGTTTEQAHLRADALRLKIANTPVGHGEIDVRVTVSAGVAGFPDHGRDSETLFKQADEALYAAKNAGRNQVMTAKVPALAPSDSLA